MIIIQSGYWQSSCNEFCTVIQFFTERRNLVKLHCHVHPHLFRHTSATIALHNGMPIEQVKEFLGHANIKNTLIYAKSNDNEIQNSHEKYV